MESIQNIKREDVRFCNECVVKNPGKDFFKWIKYDKTLNERTDTTIRSNKYCLEALKITEQLKKAIAIMEDVVAARITGSVPVGICGAAAKNTDVFIVKDKIVLKAVNQSKRPDLDVEMIVKSQSFLKSNEFTKLEKLLTKLNKNYIRVSLGLISYNDTAKHNIRNVVRWGFLHNGIVLKGEEFYRKRFENTWDYIEHRGIRKNVVEFVGYHHLLYSLQNSIKYGRIDTTVIEKNLHPTLYNSIIKWDKVKNPLFFKKDYV